MSKIILHVDLNKFFVRCEELKNPYIVGKPVVVGGDGRKGIVSTCSYEARKYGIHSGMPTFQAKMLCKDLIIIGGDYKYYELMSKEFINYVKRLLIQCGYGDDIKVIVNNRS
jgi:DNA polymerase-4